MIPRLIMWVMSTASAAKNTMGLALALLLPCFACELTPINGLDAGAPATETDAAPTTPLTRQPIGADALCQKLIGECGLALTQSACLAQYFPLRVVAACANGVATATCADFKSTTTAFSLTCFPACTAGTAPVCNADGTITLCTDSSTVNVHDCRDSCTSLGYTAWTGACGTTFDGQVGGRPQCWCR